MLVESFLYPQQIMGLDKMLKFHLLHHQNLQQRQPKL